jgi:hypothetical protein
LPYTAERDSTGKIIFINKKNKLKENHFFPKKRIATILSTSRTEPSSNLTILPVLENNSHRESAFNYKEQMQAKAFGDLYQKKHTDILLKI